MMESNSTTFAELAARHGKEIVNGDSTAANRTHAQLSSLAGSIPTESRCECLAPLCRHADASVRMWAATYLLPIDEALATDVLMKIKNEEQSILSLTAKTTLDMWKKGMLQNV